MTKITTILFDFDGVVADTESLYDIFWSNIGKQYDLGIDNFSKLIKGTTLPNIYAKYFTHFSKEEQEKISQACADFEKTMEFPEVPGSLKFIRTLRENGFKLGLVTSSGDVKMAKAFDVMGLSNAFDTIVTADRISKGKPDPMCYLLAASDLGVPPGNCAVFEDSFSGIQAGTSAGMRVVGLSTTNSTESLSDKVYAVIPDFEDIDGTLELLK